MDETENGGAGVEASGCESKTLTSQGTTVQPYFWISGFDMLK